MKCLTILATAFFGGPVWVGADYFLEFRYPTPWSTRDQPVMANYLYACRGLPLRKLARETDKSECFPITTREQKTKIYLTCTFYSVHRPRLTGQKMIGFADRRITSDNIWHVGFFNHAMDHPEFVDQPPEDIAIFRTKVEAMGVDTIVPAHRVNTVALYLAQTNMIRFSRIQGYLNLHLTAFVDVIRSLTNGYGNIDRRAAAAAQNINRYGEAMKTCLGKMVDPCSVLRDNAFRPTASEYCVVYCNFFNVVARHFGPVAHRCSYLNGGQCVRSVCTCQQQLPNVHRGCHITTTPMQFCNSLMRTKLNLFVY